MNYPKKVFLREDGPREGFQSLAKQVPTADKLKLIEMLVNAGAKSIEVTSFVRPDKVPQHADAEELATQLQKNSGVRYRGLYLNEHGLRRAMSCKSLRPEGYILFASSESFLKRNNNQSFDEAIKSLDTWVDLLSEFSLPLDRLMISTAFGDKNEGRIKAKETIDLLKRVIEKLASLGTKPEEITYADTTGYANPNAISELVHSSRDQWPEIEVGLHLHDTRGTGMANVLAGLQAGVTRFDASVAGLGGCPFVTGAAGNVATEDVGFLCQELGIETGLDLSLYIEAAKFAEEISGKPLAGKLKSGGLL